MSERYCFVCDTPVDAEVCPTCGATTWLPSGEPGIPRTDDHLREISSMRGTVVAEEQDLDASPVPPTPVPPPLPDHVAETEQAFDTRQTRSVRTPGRWAPIAAVVVAGIVLMSVLAGPSGNAPEEEIEEPPPVTAQTTTTVPAPGSSRGLWWPPSGTWVGGFQFAPSRPQVVYGPSLTAGLLDIGDETTIIDSLPDGRLIGQDSESGEVVLISDSERLSPPLPAPGADSMTPLLSPDGTRLALIDRTGAPHVWTVGTESATSTAESISTAVQAIESFSWSPDSALLALNSFQGSYYVWDVVSNEVGAPLPGRAAAVTRDFVAAWGAEGLELRDHNGRVLRRWNDIFPLDEAIIRQEGAFDPLQRFLVVRGTIEPSDEEGEEILVLLSTIGTTRRSLTTVADVSFAWSGDGSGLYWLDSQGLHVWSADPERASTTLVETTGAEPLHRLSVYDPAMSPVRHPQLETAALLERRAGSLNVRTLEGLTLLDFEEGFQSILPTGVPAHVFAVAAGEEELPVLLANRQSPGSWSMQVLGNLSSLQLPAGAQLIKAVALTPDDDADLTPTELEATRWYLETDSGSILHGPEANLFTTAAEGSSLNLLGGSAFYVTADGSAIQTIPIGTGIDTVLTAEDLDAQRILAVGTIRRALFVLVAGTDGATHLWQVPADSSLLTTPLFPPAPAMTSDAWIVQTFREPAFGGRILSDPDTGPSGELLAVRIDGPEGSVTIAVAAPLALESVCGASAGGACVLFTVPGEPLGFSPDGNWLLIAHGDRYTAYSTVGRGSIEFPDPPPDGVAWIEASS